MHFLPGRRFFLREFAPRVIVLTLLFAFVVDHLPGLAFRGSFVAASTLAFVMSVNFMLIGVYLASWAPFDNFVKRHQGKLWLSVAMVGFAFIEPAVVLSILGSLSFHAFSIDGVFAALIASLLMNAGCALTHDWGAGKASKQ
jgi:hypothetical protein